MFQNNFLLILFNSSVLVLKTIAKFNTKFRLSLFSMDNFSLTKIICHRNSGNEFAFTHTAKITYIT